MITPDTSEHNLEKEKQANIHNELVTSTKQDIEKHQDRGFILQEEIKELDRKLHSITDLIRVCKARLRRTEIKHQKSNTWTKKNALAGDKLEIECQRIDRCILEAKREEIIEEINTIIDKIEKARLSLKDNKKHK